MGFVLGARCTPSAREAAASTAEEGGNSNRRVSRGAGAGAKGRAGARGGPRATSATPAGPVGESSSTTPRTRFAFSAVLSPWRATPHHNKAKKAPQAATVAPVRLVPRTAEEARCPSNGHRHDEAEDGETSLDASQVRYDDDDGTVVVLVEEVGASTMRVPYPPRRRPYTTLPEGSDDDDDAREGRRSSTAAPVPRLGGRSASAERRRGGGGRALPRHSSTSTPNIADVPIVLRDEDLLPSDYEDDTDADDDDDNVVDGDAHAAIAAQVVTEWRQTHIQQRLAAERHNRGIHHGPPHRFVPPPPTRPAAGVATDKDHDDVNEEERSWTEDITAAVRHILLSPKPPESPPPTSVTAAAAVPAATPSPVPPPARPPTPSPVALVQRLQERGLWPESAGVLPTTTAAVVACSPLAHCAPTGGGCADNVGGCGGDEDDKAPVGCRPLAAATGARPWSCTPDDRDVHDPMDDDDSLILGARGASSLASEHPDDELHPAPQPPPRHRVRSLRGSDPRATRAGLGREVRDRDDDANDIHNNNGVDDDRSLVSGTESSYDEDDDDGIEDDDDYEDDDDDDDDYTEFRQPRHRRGCHACGAGAAGADDSGCSEHYAEFQKRRRQRVRDRGDDHEFSMTQELQDLFSDCTYLFRFFGEHYLDGERSEQARGCSRGGRPRRRKRLGNDRRPLPAVAAPPPTPQSLSPRRVRSLSPRRRPTATTTLSAEWV